MVTSQPVQATAVSTGRQKTLQTDPIVQAESGHTEEGARILAARAGDQVALAELYESHRAGALAFARSLVRTAHDAEDVFHEAFTKTINAISNGAGPSENFPAYLNTAIRATAAGWWKRSTRELPVESTVLDQTAANDPRLEAITDHAEHTHVLTAIQSLPERWQRVLWYADVLQHKPRHIAPLMGIGPNAVSALLRRARQGLRAAHEEILIAHTETLTSAQAGQHNP